MTTFEKLLENYWFVKDINQESYNLVKRDLTDETQDFIKNKLGYKLIVNPYVIKMEKIPGKPQEFMGIQEFDTKLEYVFLCLILIYLEERTRGEQFILSGLIDYIQNLVAEVDIHNIKIDFTIYSQRKSMVKVLKFIKEMGFIKLYDGDENKFAENIENDVLYEVTGISKYFMRNFSSNITECNSYTEIMSNSLRGLSDEDLKAVSESIENMNKTKEQLENLQISEKALKQIITPYDNYNKCILYNKAKKYDEKQKRYIKTQKEASEIMEKIAFNKKAFEEMKAKKIQVENEYEIYKYKEKELRANEIWKQKEEQIEIEKQVKELEDEEEEIKEIERTRTRSDITCFVNGRRINLNNLKEYIEETIEETKNLVDDEDRHLFEEILIGAVGRKIRERIYSAKAWVDSMNKLMKSLNTSSGLSFSLNWKPKLAIDENEIDTKAIVDILNSDAGLLRQSDIKKVATHFRTKFAKAEKEFTEKGAIVPFYNIIKETLDYRKWFEFQFMYKKSGEQSRELTNNAFYKLSGGEKAMAMYIPLFASVCARYQSARIDCLRIISLDEAFAGVDDNNIRDMFRILTELDLEYVINSQVLWGEYDTVPSLSICELISDVNRKVVSVMRYYWNGKKRELLVEK